MLTWLELGTASSPKCAVCGHGVVDHFHADPERRCGECVQRSCGCKCYQSKFTRDVLRIGGHP